MNGLRLMAADSLVALVPCCRCGFAGGRWDRIADQSYCPQCQELLVLGETEPLVLPVVKHHCSICDHIGTVSFHTFPLKAPTPVEIDLCAEHLRCLIGRRLGPFAYHQLRRQLNFIGISASEVFLLHDAFYDPTGKAIQPVNDIGLAG